MYYGIGGQIRNTQIACRHKCWLVFCQTFSTRQLFAEVQSPITLWKRCDDAVQSHRTPFGGVYLEHAQNKRRGLAFAKRVKQRAVGMLWQRCWVIYSAVGALWARRVHAEKTPCKSSIWTRPLQCTSIIIKK